jgi:DNA-binding NarL/FixJ family response regulator
MARLPKRQANLSALMRAARTARSLDSADTAHAQRQEIADFCRYLGARLNGELLSGGSAPLPVGLKLSPRMRQTLDRLLAGDSEKQIARTFDLSQHTVHVYVKAIYRGFDVSSRSELLARFVQVPRIVRQSVNEDRRTKASSKPPGSAGAEKHHVAD